MVMQTFDVIAYWQFATDFTEKIEDNSLVIMEHQ